MSKTSNWPLPVNGIRYILPQITREMLSKSPLTKDLYPHSMGYYPHAFQHKMERESHDDYLLIYCSAGKGKLLLDETNHTIQAGDVVLLPKNSSHQYEADQLTPWTIYWFHFLGQQAKEMHDEIISKTTTPVFHIGVDPTLISDFTRLLSSQNTGYQLQPLIHSCAIVRQIMTYIMITTYENDTQLPESIKKVQSLMRHQLHQQLNLDQLCETSGFSKPHFIRIYKEHTGFSPVQHFLQLKMEYACQRLDQTRHPVSQIAAELGYTDPYYFSRLFKKVTGISPRAYRELKV